jgi:hypothetical protein
MQDNEEENQSRVGAPLGNTNSNKNNRLWADTIRRALIQSDGERIRRIAEALLVKAEDGDMNAIKEVGDRLDGKASQAIEANITGDLSITHIARSIIDPANNTNT